MLCVCGGHDKCYQRYLLSYKRFKQSLNIDKGLGVALMCSPQADVHATSGTGTSVSAAVDCCSLRR